MSDVTPISTPKPKKARGKGKGKKGNGAAAKPAAKPKKRGQLQVPGTEHVEIEELTQLNEERLAAVRDRLSAQARETDTKKRLKDAVKANLDKLTNVSKKEGTERYLYRYEDDEGIERTVAYVVKTTQKANLEFGDGATRGDDEHADSDTDE